MYFSMHEHPREIVFKKYPTMRLLLFTFLFLNLFSTTAQTPQGILEGTLRDSVTHEELIGASVKVVQNGIFIKGLITDFNGSYRILLDPGIYEAEFIYTGYKSRSVSKAMIETGQTTRQNVSLFATQIITDWHPRFYYPHLIDKSPGNSGFTFTSQMLRHTY